MKLEIRDSPGQLITALKPVSDLGGNIKSVIHERDPVSDKETLDVEITLEMPEEKLESLKEMLRKNGVSILRIGEERYLVRRSVILIGHLMHTDLSDTVDRIDATGFAEVGELSMLMPAINEPTSAKMTIKSDSIENINRAMEILKKVAKQKKILIVEPLEGTL
ncbi:amino acid-binding protein [Methanomicrobium sp. W14]|uniref:amino acid-binding protein n=1 Tax=Methanomicrobium sp. W14 TaxID=2817839 RepID=UPI001AE7F13D|nr:amino acid-binding protein [Methanomicrobium sp. W14]